MDLDAHAEACQRSVAGRRVGPRWVQDRSIVSLFWRVFLLNAVLLIGAGVVLAVSPVEISTPTRVIEEAVLAVGVLVLLAANYCVVAACVRAVGAACGADARC